MRHDLIVLPAHKARHNYITNKVNAPSLFNFQDTEANSDIKHEENIEEQDITNVDIVPCEVTSH